MHNNKKNCKDKAQKIFTMAKDLNSPIKSYSKGQSTCTSTLIIQKI